MYAIDKEMMGMGENSERKDKIEQKKCIVWHGVWILCGQQGWEYCDEILKPSEIVRLDRG